MMTGMTPEEAENFYVEDEDPGEVFAWFDAGPDGVTACPAAVQQPASAEMVSRVLASGLYGRLRQELLPEVSASGSNTRYAQQA
jgi:hypothetical protein